MDVAAGDGDAVTDATPDPVVVPEGEATPVPDLGGGATPVPDALPEPEPEPGPGLAGGRVRVEVIGGSAAVQPGQQVRYRFRVANDGAGAARLRLAASTSPPDREPVVFADGGADLASDPVELGPGEEVVVEAAVTVPPTARGGQRNTTTLTADLAEGG